MEWNKDPRPRFIKTGGGYWRCKVTHQASRKRYDTSEKGRAADRRYRQGPTGRLTRELDEMSRVRVRY